MRLSIFILAVFVLLSCVCVFYMRAQLLQNALETGTSLAKSYAVEEQNNISLYSTLLELGTRNIDEHLGDDPANADAWMYDYLERLNIYFGESFDPFAVVNGRCIFANPREDPDAYDYASEEWYIRAVEADGDIVYTDIHDDAYSGKRVITAAKKAGGSDSVIAFNIFPESFNYFEGSSDIPEGGRYYLCDSSGGLIYYQTDYGESYEECQNFAAVLLGGIERGDYSEYGDMFDSKKEGKRGVYYYKMSNGWTSILTIQMSSILGGLNYFYVILILLVLAFMLAALYLTYRDYKNKKNIERARDTVQVLGNMYYAIYRVDYLSGTYEAIKASDHVRDRIGLSGSYERLIDTINEVTDENTGQDFKQSFSTEKIKELVRDGVKDFGGDFLRRFGTTYRWVNVRLLFDDNLAPGEVVLCFRRIDDEKGRQTEQLNLLRNALRSARKSENAKNVFFSNMSHDMRTPLNAIIGLTTLAKNNIDDKEKLGEYIRKIELSSTQLLSLINDVLEISRIENGKVSLEYKPVDLKECVSSCADLFRDQAAKEHKKFTINCDIKNNMVLCDSFRLTQIINNILSNSFKYSNRSAKIKLSVTEMTFKEHSKYRIVVEDTGIGMTKEFLKTIFEPYAQENRFGAGNVMGTGLGMPIVKSLVQQMSGEIFVESEYGKGSKFTVIIPMETAEDHETAEENNAESEAPAKLDLNGLKVLMAEDNVINMEIAAELLSDKGIEVTEAWNGAEAVSIFKDSEPHTFDAVLMDMQMPVMDGCEAARHIRALGRDDARTVPIIAVTANAFAEDVAMTTEAGMNAHISKPIDFEELGRVLSEHVKR